MPDLPEQETSAQPATREANTRDRAEFRPSQEASARATRVLMDALRVPADEEVADVMEADRT